MEYNILIIMIQKKVTNQSVSQSISNNHNINKGGDHSIQVFNYKLPNGSVYTGQLVNGKFEGKGILKYNNNQRYQGSFYKGMKHGFGKYYYKSGQYYIGDWLNNMKHGYGKYIYDHNKRYEGQFKNNLKHGFGKIFENNGNTYEGQFFQNHQHNKGLFFDSTKNKTFQLFFNKGKQINLNKTQPMIQKQKDQETLLTQPIQKQLPQFLQQQQRVVTQVVSNKIFKEEGGTFKSLISQQNSSNFTYPDSQRNESMYKDSFNIRTLQMSLNKNQMHIMDIKNESLKSKRIDEWQIQDVCQWLEQIYFADFIADFQNNLISGQALLYLTQQDLLQLNIVNQIDRHVIKRQLKLLKLIFKTQCLNEQITKIKNQQLSWDLIEKMANKQHKDSIKKLDSLLQYNKQIKRQLIRRRKQIIEKKRNQRKISKSFQRQNKSQKQSVSSSSSSSSSTTSQSQEQQKKQKNKNKLKKRDQSIKKFIFNKKQAKKQKVKKKRSNATIQNAIYEYMSKKNISLSNIVPRQEVQLHKNIGKGSYGQVFLGTWIGQRVAVKRYRKKKGFRNRHIKNFLEQAEITYKLLHPRIVLYMGMFIHNNQYAMIMQYLPGGNLFDYLHVKGYKPSDQKIISICKDVACGMAYLHAKDIIHCDLKSSNLIFNQNSRIKIVDFGLSQDTTNRKNIIRNKTRIGTPLWMAPQVMRGQNYEPSSDIYSFGIILWELMTCQIPYREITQNFTIQRNGKNLIPQISDPQYPNQFLVDLFKSCTNLQAKKRPTFLQICIRLDEYQKSE